MGGGSGLGASQTAKVASIFIYPVKSCRGIAVSQAPVTSTGFRWDRQWMVVNSRGRACTQRVEPKLALVNVELPNEAFSDVWEPTKSSYMESSACTAEYESQHSCEQCGRNFQYGFRLIANDVKENSCRASLVSTVLRAPGMDALKVSLSKPCQPADGISVWEWSGSGLDEGDQAANWFSTYLGKPSRLVRFNAESETRAVDPEYARGYKTMFADGYPFLLISEGSLDALNKLLKEPVAINRFRPNILVNGCEPFSEDLWMEIKMNKLSFAGVKLCSRCKVPTINQETAKMDPEITETLKKFRSDKVLRATGKQKGQVYFGQNMTCKDSLGEQKGKLVRVGDPVYVIKKVCSAGEAAA